MKAVYDFFLPTITVMVICSLLYLFIISSNDWFYTRANAKRGSFNPNRVVEDTRSDKIIEEIERYASPH